MAIPSLFRSRASPCDSVAKTCEDRVGPGRAGRLERGSSSDWIIGTPALLKRHRFVDQ